jgi:Protein of unknown function (DUF998)
VKSPAPTRCTDNNDVTTVLQRQFKRPRATRALLCCGAAAGPLFVSVFVVEGAQRADYKSLRHPVSSLTLGPRGSVQVANFAEAGTLYLAGAAGLVRAREPLLGTRLGPALFGGVGLGLLGSAAFATDPVSGYPPGTPDTPTEQTTNMTLHDIAALPIFLGIPSAAFAYARRFHQSGDPTWALYSAATAVSMLGTMGLAGAGFNQAPRLVNFAGLLQRVAIVTGFGWLTALSARALRCSQRLSERSAT